MPATIIAARTKRSETERVGLLLGQKTDEEVNFICRVCPVRSTYLRIEKAARSVEQT